MRMIYECNFFLNRDILVCLESVVSGHKINLIRPRLGDKMEVLRFDPWSELAIHVHTSFLI